MFIMSDYRPMSILLFIFWTEYSTKELHKNINIFVHKH